MQEVTNAFIKTLAAANGIDVPEERLDLVRRQYESLMRNLAQINSLSMPRETEPAVADTTSGRADGPLERQR